MGRHQGSRSWARGVGVEAWAGAVGEDREGIGGERDEISG